jgi:hypothetical protein
MAVMVRSKIVMVAASGVDVRGMIAEGRIEAGLGASARSLDCRHPGRVGIGAIMINPAAAWIMIGSR